MRVSALEQGQGYHSKFLKMPLSYVIDRRLIIISNILKSISNRKYILKSLKYCSLKKVTGKKYKRSILEIICNTFVFQIYSQSLPILLSLRIRFINFINKSVIFFYMTVLIIITCIFPHRLLSSHYRKILKVIPKQNKNDFSIFVHDK